MEADGKLSHARQARKENEERKRGKNEAYRRCVDDRGEKRNRGARGTRTTLSPQVLAYRYLGTRVRLRLTTGIAAPLVPADKKPATKRTRDAKSARDVSIDSLTADL